MTFLPTFGRLRFENLDLNLLEFCWDLFSAWSCSTIGSAPSWSAIFIYKFHSEVSLLIVFNIWKRKLIQLQSGPSPGSPISSTNKTDRHDITEILLKVALNTIKQTITEIDLFLFFQIVKNFNIKSAFLSNQSFVNVVCRLLNAAKVETNTSFNHRVYWPCLTWKYACTCCW